MEIGPAINRARAEREASTEALFDLIRIPSVSALPEHQADCRRAAEWVAGRLGAAGMTVEVVDMPGPGLRHPVVAAEWLGAPGRPTLALYGHYDVQPADPVAEWSSPPFEPTERDGFVYARGSDDNKGQLMASVRALEIAFAEGRPPVNVRFLLEGEEEVGGRSLPEYLRANAARLAADYLLIADGQFTAPGLPSLLTGLRGLLYTEIEARGAAVDLHSGAFGGVAPNPLNTLAHVISGLKHRDGHVNIPGFYDAVLPPSEQELAGWRALPITEETEVKAMGVRALEGESDFSPLERKWARPTLDVHGIAGGFVGTGQKTVIPARATAKVSMRLVPAQDPDRLFEALVGFVSTLSTPGVELTVRRLSQGHPVRIAVDHPGIAAARTAFAAAYGAQPVLSREGGSIPVVADFEESLGCGLLITGFGLPGDALHSPNERMSLDQYHRGVEMVLHLMHELGG